MYIPQVDEFVLYEFSGYSLMAQCVARNGDKAAITYQWGTEDKTKWVPFAKLLPADIPPAVDVEGETDDHR
jgi:hypothetical protein